MASTKEVKCTVLLLVVIASAVEAAINSKSHFKQVSSNEYTDTWVVQFLKPQVALEETAELLATNHGLVNLGQVGNLDGYYAFKQPTIKRSLHPLNGVEERKHITQAIESEADVGFVQQQKKRQRYKKKYSYPRDPKFSKQWALVNIGQTNGKQGLDLNVEPVWLQGVTGSGVVVSVVDDGLEVRHPEIAPNYDAFASWDFAYNDSDPTPTNYFGEEPDSHGTSCAGEIAMAKNNNKCGVGIAYDSSIGCIKFDMKENSDLTEATFLGYKNDYIQVYSNSWGPSDIGFVVDGPGRLLQATFKDSVTKGRGGRGSIFVWAAGNGGWSYDSCAVDGYSSSIYTIAVGSADQNAGQAGYDESCPGKMVVTYAFNSDTFTHDRTYNQVYTTTLNGDCTDSFTGTSASTPMLSAVLTLAIQVNPKLTWRDVQYLLVYTSNPNDLHNGEWSVNGGGRKVSHKFGFGAVDAEALVTRARHWKTVPQHMESIVYPNEGTLYTGTAQYGQQLTVKFTVSENNSSVHFLEHVVLTASISIENRGRAYTIDDYDTFLYEEAIDEASVERWLQDPHPRRGDIKIDLTSPQGTTSTLLPYRKYDFVNVRVEDENVFTIWPFMSVHHWGEDPTGEWQLTVTFKSSTGYINVRDLDLRLYGTNNTPGAVRSMPAQCNDSCTRGCYGPGSDQCDVCRELRVVSTLECVTHCPNGTFEYKQYCTPYLITIPGPSMVGLAVGVSMGILLLLVMASCILACILVYAFKRKKAERIHRIRYSIMQSEDDSTAFPV